MTADVPRILDDARTVFIRLDEDATRYLEQSWRGHAGRQALEALRRYISDALGGLAGRPAFPSIAMPTAPASAASPGTPTATVPAGLGGIPPISTAPMAHNRSGFDDDGLSMPTHPAASPPVAQTPATTPQSMLNDGGPVHDSRFNAATPSAVPSSAPTSSTLSGQPRTAVPHTPMMGTAYPGAFARDDPASRRTPRYLINVDNGNELIGPLPKVSPPVIGDG